MLFSHNTTLLIRNSNIVFYSWQAARNAAYQPDIAISAYSHHPQATYYLWEKYFLL
jgi:hypothetical protein